MAGRNFVRGIGLLTSVWVLGGCESDTWKGDVPAADPVMFQSAVYPLLLRDCGFNACHGGEHRFFEVYGPGRVRLNPLEKPDTPATPVEIDITYRRAVSMLITQGPIEHAPLLTKPLEAARGGAGHKGVDDFGRNVYATTKAAGYQTLLTWAKTATPATTSPVVGVPTAGAPAVAGAPGG